MRIHIRDVRVLLRRALAALALVPCLVFGPVVPQEHVHDADQAHTEPIAHRHVEFHQHVEAQPLSTPDHDAPEMAPDEERVVWVAGISLGQRAFHLAPNWVVLDEPPAAALGAAGEASRQPDIDSSPPHGPPLPSFSLRGPPLASA